MSRSRSRLILSRSVLIVVIGTGLWVSQGGAQAQTQVTTSQLFKNTEIITRIGRAMVGLGDVNGDGYGDYAASAEDFAVAPWKGGRVVAFSGRTGLPLWKVIGTSGDDLGKSMALIHDFNKDGVRDLLVGAPGFDALGKKDSGQFQILSGKTGATLKARSGGAAKDGFGGFVTALGDVNKDGVPDFAITSSTHPNGTGWGAVDIFSGKDASTVIVRYTGKANGDGFGAAVADLGDIDKDGYADVIISAPGAKSLKGNLGYIRAYSSRFRFMKYEIQGSTNSAIGTAITPIGDLTKDGASEILVNRRVPSVEIRRAKDGKLLKAFWYPGSTKVGGIPSHAALGDLDADGVPDYAIGFDGGPRGPSGFWIYSGATNRILHTLQRRYLGKRIANAGDIDGDGHTDLLVQEMQGGYPVTAKPDSVFVFSLRHLILTTDAHRISVTKGGAVQHFADAGKGQAGRYLFMVGSLSGEKPGFKVMGFHLPLNLFMGAAMDPWLSYTISNINSPILTNSFSPLDANGKGSMTFKILPVVGVPLLGRTFHHAYMVIDLKRLAFTMASNARPTTLVK